tara:strand:- start:22 stop:234 length:213 start_codon:yes stop_codon:yes gene_type:complete
LVCLGEGAKGLVGGDGRFIEAVVDILDAVPVGLDEIFKLSFDGLEGDFVMGGDCLATLLGTTGLIGETGF